MMGKIRDKKNLGFSFQYFKWHICRRRLSRDGAGVKWTSDSAAAAAAAANQGVVDD